MKTNRPLRENQNFIKAVIRNIGPGQFGGMKGFFAFSQYLFTYF